MPTKGFRHLGEDWEVTGLGTGHGIGFGFLPKISSWAAEFKSVSNPARGPYRGRIPAADPSTVDDSVLRQAVEVPVVVDTLRRSGEPWRTVESLSAETGVDPARVNRILEWESGDVVQSDLPDSQGRVLYAVRDRYAEATPFVKQYLNILSTSST
jgi:hypothetical protein